MTSHLSDQPVSALRARMIEDMSVRGFSEKTRNDYIRNVRAFAAFTGRSPTRRRRRTCAVSSTTDSARTARERIRAKSFAGKVSCAGTIIPSRSVRRGRCHARYVP
jgi:hypothetical protein